MALWGAPFPRVSSDLAGKRDPHPLRQTCGPSGTQTARELRSRSRIAVPIARLFIAIAVWRPRQCSPVRVASAVGR